MPTRRHFLRSLSVPLFLTRTAWALPPGPDQRVLVVVQLDGGNDALNTVVPFADPEYAKLRPRLKLDPTKLLRLVDGVGLHPALKPLDKLLSAGNVAVVPGVGYPNPNRSHFESMAIWHTARPDPDDRPGTGWLGRAFDPAGGTLYAVGGDVPAALRGRRCAAAALERIDDVLFTDPDLTDPPGTAGGDDVLAFVRRQATDARTVADRLAKLSAGGGNGYPSTGLADRLRLTARLLKADLGGRVFYVTQSGYDTHARQSDTHGDLLREFAGAVAAFFADLAAAKLADRVALLAFSEFGRTVKENGSAGTDHGTAGAAFVVGPGVRGGLVGAMPSLTDLVGGEPKPTTDFRGVYAGLLADWLAAPADPGVTGIAPVRFL